MLSYLLKIFNQYFACFSAVFSERFWWTVACGSSQNDFFQSPHTWQHPLVSEQLLVMCIPLKIVTWAKQPRGMSPIFLVILTVTLISGLSLRVERRKKCIYVFLHTPVPTMDMMPSRLGAGQEKEQRPQEVHPRTWQTWSPSHPSATDPNWLISTGFEAQE